MNLLALDLGTHLGWALRLDGRVYSGQEDFSLHRGDSPGMRFLRLRSFLDRMAVMGDPLGVVVYEQPHLRGGAAASVLAGMEAEVLAFCAGAKLQHTAVHTGSLKKYATGHGNASKGDMMAAAAIRYEGIAVGSDDEADALMLLAYAEEILSL